MRTVIFALVAALVLLNVAALGLAVFLAFKAGRESGAEEHARRCVLCDPDEDDRP